MLPVNMHKCEHWVTLNNASDYRANGLMDY